MATNKQIKFFKGANAPAAPVAGMIWFCTEDRTIRVYTGSAWEKYAGLVDAAWNGTDKKLTITSAAGTTTTLDLSDCASASDLATKLQTINNTLTAHDGRITAAQNAADAAAQAASVADGKAVQEKTDREAAIEEVKGLISAEASRADAAEKAALAAAEAADTKAGNAQSYAEGVNTALGNEVTRATAKEGELAGKISALEAAVGEGGSVDTQIAAKIADLDADITSAEGTQVRVQVVEVDGKITEVKVTESATFATAQALADEIADREADEATIGARIDALDAAGDAEGNGKGRVTVLEEQVRALNAATHFEGVVEFDPAAEGATVDGYDPGDIVIYGSKEYIFDGEKWIELGDTTAEQGRISALESWKTTASQTIADNTAAHQANAGDITALQNRAKTIEDTMATDDEVEGIRATLQGNIDTVSGTVSNHGTRIEALETTSNALANTYVAKSDYATDKAALEQKDADLQGEIDAAEGRLDTAEAAIERITGEQTTQDGKIKANEDAIAALQQVVGATDTGVMSVSSSDAYVAVDNTDAKNPVLSLNVNGVIAEGNTGLVKGGDIFNELCWVEFE